MSPSHPRKGCGCRGPRSMRSGTELSTHVAHPCRKLEAAEARCRQQDLQACRERDEARAGAARHSSAAAAAAEQQADELRRCA